MLRERRKLMKKIRCENCDWDGDLDGKNHVALTEVDNLAARISPGERVPAGECPDCGAFVHLDNMTIDDALAVLEKSVYHDDNAARDALDILSQIFETANLTFHCPRCTGTRYDSEQIGNTFKRICRSCPSGKKFSWLDRDDNKYLTWAVHIPKESMGRK
jgi:predicted RNA-binding Zn-ribbon protein involved in translation (DUF1610 family)